MKKKKSQIYQHAENPESARRGFSVRARRPRASRTSDIDGRKTRSRLNLTLPRCLEDEPRRGSILIIYHHSRQSRLASRSIPIDRYSNGRTESDNRRIRETFARSTNKSRTTGGRGRTYICTMCPELSRRRDPIVTCTSSSRAALIKIANKQKKPTVASTSLAVRRPLGKTPISHIYEYHEIFVSRLCDCRCTFRC